MPGGGTKTQTTTENKRSDPWAPAQPALMDMINRASGLLDQGAGGGVYGGPRVAGLGATTQAGFGMMRDNIGAANSAARQGAGFVDDLVANDGATDATRRATSRFGSIDPTVDTRGVAQAAARLSNPNSVPMTVGRSLAGGEYQTDTTGLERTIEGLAGPSQTKTSLQEVADGKFLGGANPYTEAMIARSGADAASSVAQRFAGSGRYGSGRFSGAVADAVTGVGTELRYKDYDNERNRQVQAATAIDSAEQSRAGTTGSLYQGLAGINTGNANIAATGANLVQNAQQAGLAGQATLAGIRGSNVDRQLNQAGTLLTAAQGDRAAGLAGVAALPTVQSALMQPGQTMTQIGLMQDAARQDQINANMQAFAERQAAPWKPLGLASQIINPIAGMGGTSSGTSETEIPEPGLLQQRLGYGLAGASVASKFMGAP